MPRKNKPLIPVRRIIPTTCLKRAYKTKLQAERAIAERDLGEELTLGAYICPSCGKWHLTSK